MSTWVIDRCIEYYSFATVLVPFLLAVAPQGMQGVWSAVQTLRHVRSEPEI